MDGDTIISPGSKDATFDAVGSIIAAIDGVENKEFKNAFCAVRPPGHHSSQNKAAGFCILNSVSTVSYTHLRAPRDGLLSRMPSSA